MKSVVLLALVSCAAPFKFQPPTPGAIAARRAASELNQCLRDANGWPDFRRACAHAAAASCLRAGLPKDCATEELWFQRVPVGAESGPPGTIPRGAGFP